MRCTDDPGTIETLTHLLTREITHTNMFLKALDSLGKQDDAFFGTMALDSIVDITINLSQGGDFRGA